MWRSLLGSFGIEHYLHVLSPAFFRVLPPRKLWRRARSLVAASRDEHADARARARRADALARADLGIVLTSTTQGPTLAPSPTAARVVELYFHQIFSDAPSLIDLRAQAFGSRDAALTWSPARWLVEWDPAFIGPLRDVYRAFYADDDAAFTDAIARLGMAGAEDVFRTHFAGAGRMKFSLDHFARSFDAVFRCCRDERIELHPDFLPLGLFLASMYEHLEALDVEVDVGACFHRAVATSSTTVPSPRAEVCDG